MENPLLYILIGVVIPIIVGMIPIFFSKKRKIIEYDLKNIKDVVIIDRSVKEKVTVTYTDNENNEHIIKDLKIIEITIENIGNQEILETDFNESLSLFFGENAKIITIELSKNERKNLFKYSVRKAEIEEFIIEPLLLNPKDKLTLEFVISKFENLELIRGKIIGGKIRKKERKNFLLYTFIVGGIFCLTGMAFMFLPINIYITLSLMIIGLIIVTLAMANTKESKQNFRNTYKNMIRYFTD